ncbi:MAG: NAD(+) diphosphatase [Actinomycetota bacterium]|nr:NAD(+) diphosphatase [Acidimicrobiia bacterium]MDQ3293567.1 NAD(+) diphosphatase [Actinomycetota bacterium]
MPFQPLTDPPADEADGPCLVVAVHAGSSVLVVDDRAPADGLFLGTLDGRHCWAVDVVDEDDVDTDLFKDLRLLWGAIDEVPWIVAGRAVQLVEWRRTHRFCGRCATAMEPARGERAMRCPRCSLLSFPRLAPAVITLIHDGGDRLLLANNRNFGIPMYSLLAGFVEPGETLEEAAYRETLEEVGVEVRDLAYWGSQPWPFPHSLMLGFTARADPEAPIVLQEDEIADAKWFALDDLPMIPPVMSIAGRMIEAWKAERP